MSLPAAAFLSLTLLAALPTTAATNPAPLDGEVIVQFKPGAVVTRAHGFPARAAAGTVRDVLARRRRPWARGWAARWRPAARWASARRCCAPVA